LHECSYLALYDANSPARSSANLALEAQNKKRMEFSVFLREIKSNPELIKAYIENSSTKKLTHIEFRTHDEANIFVLPKSEVLVDFEAFVTLYSIQLHFFEGWTLSDNTSEDVDNILNLWLQPESEEYLYKEMSSTEVHKEIDWVIGSTIKLLSEDDLSEKKARNPARWGVYVNGERITSGTTLFDLGIDEIISGVCFYLEWNAIMIMYQTETDYVLFCWGTGG